MVGQSLEYYTHGNAIVDKSTYIILIKPQLQRTVPERELISSELSCSCITAGLNSESAPAILILKTLSSEMFTVARAAQSVLKPGLQIKVPKPYLLIKVAKPALYINVSKSSLQQALPQSVPRPPVQMKFMNPASPTKA